MEGVVKGCMVFVCAGIFILFLAALPAIEEGFEPGVVDKELFNEVCYKAGEHLPFAVGNVRVVEGSNDMFAHLSDNGRQITVKYWDQFSGRKFTGLDINDRVCFERIEAGQ